MRPVNEVLIHRKEHMRQASRLLRGRFGGLTWGDRAIHGPPPAFARPGALAYASAVQKHQKRKP